MKSFLVGLLIGLVAGPSLVVLIGWHSPPEIGVADPAPRPSPAAGPEPRAEVVRSEPAPAPLPAVVETPAHSVDQVDLGAGAVTLRIGEGYVFGEEGLRARTERDRVDVYCQDIREGVSLLCPLGAALALAPLTGIGLPETAEAAAALLVDAPAVLAARSLELTTRPTPKHPGIGFVRSRAGTTFKLCLIELLDHPDALDRAVRIRFAVVPALEGGGAFRLPKVLGAPTAATLEDIRNALAIGACIPGDSFRSHLNGAFSAVDELGPETFVGDAPHFVVERLSNQTLELANQGAVFVADRVGRDARIVLTRGGAAGVGSDLEGLLRTDGYAFLYVGRDVTGTIDIRSYTTAVVLGDVRGTIRVRSYTDLYVRGRILGTLDLEGSGWCRFYFQSFCSRFDLEQLKGSHGVTLHLMQSDLVPGKHTGIGKWREVIVGDPLWQKLAR